MNNEQKPSLPLGEPPKGLKIKADKATRGIFTLILIVQIVILAVLFLHQPTAKTTPASSPEGVWDYKSVAMALEDRSLSRQAAAAWERFLEQAPDATERPQVLYRVGKLYMEAGDYDRAAAALVQADLAAGEDKELKAKTGPRMVECLRHLGLYGEVGRELSRRVEVGAEDTERGALLASFAGEKFFQADFDRMVERRVDRMLSMQGGPADERQRKAFIDQMKTPSMAPQVFQEFLQLELFSRRAREMKLDREDTFQETRDFVEQTLLAARMLEQSLDKINPTAVDLEAYYETHKEEYKDEEAEEIPSFDAVRDRVMNDYVQRKQSEISQALLDDLIVRYDVKILAQPGQREESAE